MGRLANFNWCPFYSWFVQIIYLFLVNETRRFTVLHSLVVFCHQLLASTSMVNLCSSRKPWLCIPLKTRTEQISLIYTRGRSGSVPTLSLFLKSLAHLKKLPSKNIWNMLFKRYSTASSHRKANLSCLGRQLNAERFWLHHWNDALVSV